MTNFNKKLVVALTGASGSVYCIQLLSELLKNPNEIHLIVSGSGKTVLEHETDYTGEDFKAYLLSKINDIHPDSRLLIHKENDFFVPPASGSFRHDGMVIIPCSMKTLAKTASGIADNLITRSADVCLKERFPLVMVPRETPFSTIHIENMLKLSRSGAVIMPAAPSFYTKPETVSDLTATIVARILETLNIGQTKVTPWCG